MVQYHHKVRDFGFLFILLHVLGLLPCNANLFVNKSSHLRAKSTVTFVVVFHLFIVAVSWKTKIVDAALECWVILFHLNLYLNIVPLCFYTFKFKSNERNIKLLLDKILIIFDRKSIPLSSKYLIHMNLFWIILHPIASVNFMSNSFVQNMAVVSVAIQRVYFLSISLEFCAYLEIIANRLRRLARHLGKSVSDKWNLALLHSELIRTAQLCLDVFSQQLLVIVPLLSYGFVFNVYCAFRFMNSFVTFWAVSLVSGSFHLALLVFMCWACEKVNYEAEKFNSELFRLMRESKDLCKNEKLQLYVTMKQTVHFTACGFFTLGYPLVTSIIAAATTYLVILVQFSMPQK